MQKKLRLRSHPRAQVKCCKRHSPGTCITEKTTNLPFAHSLFFYQRCFFAVVFDWNFVSRVITWCYFHSFLYNTIDNIYL